MKIFTVAAFYCKYLTGYDLFVIKPSIFSINVELIQILNCLRHGISYSQHEEVDTALCL